MGSSESVGAGQHPQLVAQQAAVGRIVNVGLDHSGVDAHPPTFRHRCSRAICTILSSICLTTG
jgi:hypothetical protein